MQALGALVLENAPDVVLFVGEALTGNEGVEQLKQFDCALKSYTNSRGIDGIILTKFDTCGDKVGAALNLCFVCDLLYSMLVQARATQTLACWILHT